MLGGWRREDATSQLTSEEGASLALSGINQLRNKTGMIDVFSSSSSLILYVCMIFDLLGIQFISYYTKLIILY